MNLVGVHTQPCKDVIENSLSVDDIIMTGSPVTGVNQVAAVSGRVAGVVAVRVLSYQAGVTGEAKRSLGGRYIPTARAAITHAIHTHIDEPCQV